jgi:hypothetical protein
MSEKHKALVLSSFTKPIAVQSLPIPTATPGSAVVRVLGLPIVAYLRGILDNSLQYSLSPLFPVRRFSLLRFLTSN